MHKDLNVGGANAHNALSLPGQTDVADALSHVAVTGKRRVKGHRFRLLVGRGCSSRRRAAFCRQHLVCDDIIGLCWLCHVPLKQ